MTRSRTSARKAGAEAERKVADYLAEHLHDDRIDRRVKTGAKDRGDIGGIRVHGNRVVVEVKDTVTTDLGTWIREAEVERLNDAAAAGIVVHKRMRKADPADWYVTMTGRDLVALLTGERPA